MKKIITIIISVLIIIAGLFIYIYEYKFDIKLKPEDSSNLISIISPVKDSKVSSPLSVAGRAKGLWFFEGSFPIILTDWDGKIIAEGHASAQGDWMTNEWVKFIGTLNFTKPEYGEKGSLIFKKSNPSGLSENDNAYEITVLFK